MANALYYAAKKAFLDGNIDLLSDNLKVVLIDANDYSVDLALDTFLSAIPVGARTATSGNLSGKTTTNGTFDADDVTFTTVFGDTSEAIVIYQDTGVEATSRLIAYMDGYTGLPIIPNGDDITLAWASGKIFALQ